MVAKAEGFETERDAFLFISEGREGEFSCTQSRPAVLCVTITI